MVKYDTLAVGDPLAFVFQKLNLKWMSAIIGVSAVVAMASVLLVFQLGQPRIWMSMSRDGLLPKKFSRVHKKYHTPSYATIVTGFVVAVPALFMNLTMVTDLCSIGTLFAFVLVCAGVLKLSTLPDAPKGKFKTPYVNSKFVMPVLVFAAVILSFTYNKENTTNFLSNTPKLNDAGSFVTGLTREEAATFSQYVQSTDTAGFAKSNGDVDSYLGSLDETQYASVVKAAPVPEEKKFETGWNIFKHKIPTWIFIIITLLLTYWSITKNLSLIPLLGLVSCLYMMSEMGVNNWLGFTIWLVVGLIIYFLFSYKNSKLNSANVVAG
jgi:amino acid transporter